MTNNYFQSQGFKYWNGLLSFNEIALTTCYLVMIIGKNSDNVTLKMTIWRKSKKFSILTPYRTEGASIRNYLKNNNRRDRNVGIDLKPINI